MSYRGSWRALSPLVATVILLSATMLGGVMLYQYFNHIMKVYTSEDSVVLSISVISSTQSNATFYYEVTNYGNAPVNLNKIEILRGGALLALINLDGMTLEPGSRYANITTANLSGQLGTNTYAIVHFTSRGQALISKPVIVT
ncbi:MAG: hypothetical protein QXU97_01355 [Fervidicoccaceae archaeon]